MELVEGEDLSQRIARGPIPIDETLQIARQIAEALEAAHEQGIIHRDLKPANIKVRPDGTVKVLDFGLAKAMDGTAAASNLTHSPTLSMMATQAGVILGTAAYMSPEQAKGFPADRRSDVFAFGCVMYEMLTGRQSFRGDTAADVLASVLVREPDLTLLPPNLNPRIPDLLARCLE
jgi:eukaryotic-like serine/threonine-protein kinase